MSVTHVFFDVGGVLGTNGWDTGQRANAVVRFQLEADDFQKRHKESVEVWESGGMSLDEYLRRTIFYRPRAFTPDDFTAFMREQSVPFKDTIALARALAHTARWRMATLNNESEDLNVYRLRHFGLTDIFSAFFSSCWVGALKPKPRIYELALAMSQADPAAAVFIDDRASSLDVARTFGMQTVLYTDAERLRADLAALGVAA